MHKKPTYEELEQKIKELESALHRRKKRRKNNRNPQQPYGRYDSKLVVPIEMARQYADHAQVGLYLFKKNGFGYINPQFAHIFGYQDVQVLLKTPLEKLVAPEDLSEIKTLAENILAGKRYSFHREIRCLAQNGSLLFVESFGAAFKQNDQCVIIGTVLDIGDRKRFTSQLKESEERWRSLAQSSPEHIMLLDRNLKIEFINRSVWGMTADQMIDTNILAYLPIHRQAEIKKQLNRTLKTGETAHFETAYCPAEGRTVHYESVANVRKVAHKTVGLTLSVRDVTDKKLILEQKKISQMRLHQAQRIETIGALTSGIAHDFNNLLYPIIGQAEMLLEDIPEGTSEHESSLEIYKAATRAADLARQILSISRRSEQDKQPVIIGTILKEAFKLARATIPANIAISCNVQPDCGKVMADPTQIHQIAMNLITNAFHAVEQSGGRIAIGLKEAILTPEDIAEAPLLPGKYAVISVMDTGHGIDKAVMDKIFEPYFTTKQKGKGTGLGLSVVYGIVKENGGDIRVESRIGKGTTFKVYLPLLKKYMSTVEPQPTVTFNSGSETILLVDDEDAILKMVKQTLERLGYRVVAFNDSLKALNCFKADPKQFDLVITDMIMPILTGEKLAKEMLLINPQIPIIAFTGFTSQLSAQKASEMGMKGFIYKPVTNSKLSDMVRKILDKSPCFA